MNRIAIPAFTASLMLLSAGAVHAADNVHSNATRVADNHTDKRVVVKEKRNGTEVRRTTTERPNGTEIQRRVIERPNGNTMSNTVRERPNGTTMSRTVRERPNGNVRVTQKVIRPVHRYRARRAWVAPRGFVFRHFRLGERIPTVLLAANYFLMDYSMYGLPPAPYGYVWVRVGSDAVLVDRYTGQVVQVAYDIFY
ncbi:MAG TPA: RcnB family protein [Rhizomicrobium sp.]